MIKWRARAHKPCESTSSAYTSQTRLSREHAGALDMSRAALTDLDPGRIHRRRIFGGLINEYTHAA
jgi:hypothetical protein